MENEFTLLELRLIQTMLRKNTDEEIADILERPVDMVREYSSRFLLANNIVTSATKKQSRLNEKRIKKEWKALQKKKKESDEAAVAAQKKEMKNRRRQRELQNKKKAASMYSAKTDFSQMRSVRIDHKTVILVKPGEDIETMKRKYINNLKERTLDYQTTVEVKKFKPIK